MISKTTLALALLAGGATLAQAEPVTMIFEDYGAGATVDIEHYGFALDPTFVGQLRHNISRADGYPDFLGQRFTYCLEINEPLSYTGDDFWVTDINFSNIPSIDSEPHAAERTQAILNITAAYGQQASSTQATDSEAAAFQLAVWEIVTDYDPTLGLASIALDAGNFQSSGLSAGILNQFNLLRTAAGTQNSTDAWIIHNDGMQDQLITPAPGALALTGIALGAATRRRRR